MISSGFVQDKVFILLLHFSCFYNKIVFKIHFISHCYKEEITLKVIETVPKFILLT